MIAYLKGRVIYRDNEKSSIILETNGVGYEVFLPAAGQLKIFGILSLFIYTYIREDRITLYGFRTSLQREVFNLLLEVKNVGPKLAVTVLSGIDANNFVNILTMQDISALSQIKGIGKTKAERIIMELKNKIFKKTSLINDINAEDICNYNNGGIDEDKISSEIQPCADEVPIAACDEPENSGNRPSDIIFDSSGVLEALGYSRLESFNLVSKVYKKAKDAGAQGITVEDLTKECLKYIYSLKN